MVNKNYPHPVLSLHSDDFEQDKASFDIMISKKIKRGNYQLFCEVVLNESNLENLLSKKEVVFLVKITCSATRYREVHQFYDSENLIEIPAALLEKRVEISTYIVAKKEIYLYSSSSFNSDYEDSKFIIYAGDILAEGTQYKFSVEKTIDPLVKVPSIFTIINNDSKTASPIDVQSMGDKIVISLNKENFNKYKFLKELQNQYSNLAALTSSIFILPSLVTVIEDLKRDLVGLNEDLEGIKEYIEDKENDHRWFKVLNMRLHAEGINLNQAGDITESSLAIAQKLLGDPISNGLQFFDEFFESGEESTI